MEFLQDFRYGTRLFAKSPAFAVIAIVTLALGIAGTATIFTFTKGIIFLMPPVEKAGQMARLFASSSGNREERTLPALSDFLDWKQQSRSFSGVAATRSASYRVTGAGGEPSRLWATLVSPGYLAMLRVAPAIGRDFTEDDSRPGAEAVVILGHSVWQTQFGSDRAIVGRAILLNDRPCTVVGVLPAAFWFPFDDEGKNLLLPLPIDAAQLKRGTQKVMVFARLRDDVGKQQAQAEMDAIAKRLERQYPTTNGGWGVNITTLREDMLKRAGMGITMLFGPVVFVLLIACGNVANMLLARASARKPEIAVRAALGANRRRLLRQLLTESLLLALCAAVLGLLLSWQSVRLMSYLASSSQIHIPGLGVDRWVLLFGLAVALLTVLLFGLAPALHATRVDLVSALKERETGTGGDRRARRQRDGLIVAEVALAIVFLIGTGMMTRMLVRVRNGVANPGFNMQGLIVFDVEPPEGARPAQIAELNNRILEAIRGVPGVQSAGGAEGFDVSHAGLGARRTFFVPGARASGVQVASVSTVTPGFLDAIQIPVLRGRVFTGQDSAGSSTSAVINQTMARRYWPGSDPLGKTFKFGAAESKDAWLTVVGVVGDTWNFGESYCSVYLPMPEAEARPVQIAVRSLAPPAALIPALKDTVRRVDKSQTLEDMQPALKLIGYTDSYFVIGLMGSFAGLALVLAAVGIYGVMSYNVTERRREIGVRMALGGRRRQVLGQLVRRAFALMLGGLLLGAVPVLGFAVFQMNRYKLSIAGGDILMVGGVCLLLLACGFLAALVPAYRAIRVDPMVALRYE